MRIAYLDCASGISGDMMLGSLLDAGVDLATVQAGIDSLGLPSCQLKAADTKKCGFRALQLSVTHEPEFKHRHLHHIDAMIDGSALSEKQKSVAKKIFLRLAEAEAKVHGTNIQKVHFHEVGAVDSIADIVGSAIAWDLLGVDRVVCSAVPTGTGFVEIAHGRCAIPAPATGELLKGVPLAASKVQGELTTPTGAAIVTAVVDEFGPMPAMTIERIGYGAGQKDFSHPNLLRLVVGQTGDARSKFDSDTIALLETNLDDSTGETLGHCIALLWKAGALDVSTTAIGMKKNRPGTLLQVQCRTADSETLAEIVFRETTALGVRRRTLDRWILPRRSVIVSTVYGDVAGVVAELPSGGRRFSPEYDSCVQTATQHQVSLVDVKDAAIAAYKTD